MNLGPGLSIRQREGKLVAKMKRNSGDNMKTQLGLVSLRKILLVREFMLKASTFSSCLEENKCY